VFQHFFSMIRILMLFFVFTFETPLFLTMQHRDEETIQVLKKLYLVDVTEIQQKLFREREISQLNDSEGNSIRDMFTRYRNAMFMGLILASFQHLCGLDDVMYYSNTLFKKGLDPENRLPNMLTTMMGILNMFFTMFAVVTVGKFGRKKPLVVGTCLMFIDMLLIAIISFFDTPTNFTIKILIVLWPVAFAPSLGGITFLYLGELLPDIGMSIAVFVNWRAGFVVLQVFQSLLDLIDIHGVFFIFALFCGVGAYILERYLIESRGKTKNEWILEYCNSRAARMVRNSIKRGSKEESLLAGYELDEYVLK